MQGNCLGCADRHIGCHGDCPIYKKFITEKQKIKDLIHSTEYEKYVLQKNKTNDTAKAKVGKKSTTGIWRTANC